MRLVPRLGQFLLSPRGPWVPDLRSPTLARPGHGSLVSRATEASALARAKGDPGPSARLAKRNSISTESALGEAPLQIMTRPTAAE